MTSISRDDLVAPRLPDMGETISRKPTLAQRRPQQIPADEIGEQHRPEVSADEMQQILLALMEQQTR